MIQAAFLAILAGSCLAETQPNIDIEEFRLENGLRIILAPRAGDPAATVALGARAGYALLPFEKNEYAQIAFDSVCSKAQGSLGAQVAFCFETLPPAGVRDALWRVAKRIGTASISRRVIRRRQEAVRRDAARRDKQSTIPSFLGALPGLREGKAPLGEIRRFHAAAYAPSNVAVAVVGGFDMEAACGWAREYLAGLPKGSHPPVGPASFSARARRGADVLYGDSGEPPAVALRWPLDVERRTPDYYALVLLSRILFSRPLARMRRVLVRDQTVAVAVEDGVVGGLGFPATDAWSFSPPGFFTVLVRPTLSVRPEHVRGLVLDEIGSLGKEVAHADLEKAKQAFGQAWARRWSGTAARARDLITASMLDGGAAAANREFSRFMAVTPGDVASVARRFLSEDKAQTAYLRGLPDAR